MKVAVCVGFRPRNDHDQCLWDWSRRRWVALFPDWPILVADSGHEPFNRSASHNCAAEQADADVLIFANSDTIPLLAEDMRESVEIAVNGGWVLPRLYVEVSRGYTDVMLQEDPSREMADPLSGYDRQLTESPAGPQVMPYEWWDNVRWDESFTGWGWNDAALRDALDTLHVTHVRVGTSVHLFHPRGKAESPAANGKNRMRWATRYRKAARQGPDAMRRVLGQ